MDRPRNVCISTSIGRVCGSSAPTLYTPNQTNAEPAAANATSSNRARSNQLRVVISIVESPSEPEPHARNDARIATVPAIVTSEPRRRTERALVYDADIWREASRDF